MARDYGVDVSAGGPKLPSPAAAREHSKRAVTARQQTRGSRPVAELAIDVVAPAEGPWSVKSRRHVRRLNESQVARCQAPAG